MSLRRLIETDEAIVKCWLEHYLKEHVLWWEEAYGTKSTRGIDELVERDWQGLLKANESKKRWVQISENDKAEPVGIVEALVEKDYFLDIDIGVLGWIYVVENARGQGLADQLMKAALSWMKEKNAKGRLVNVTVTNGSAVKLYKKHGFNIVDYRMLGKAP